MTDESSVNPPEDGNKKAADRCECWYNPETGYQELCPQHEAEMMDKVLDVLADRVHEFVSTTYAEGIATSPFAAAVTVTNAIS